MEELISKQQAIDEFYKYPNINWTTLDVMEKINALPSAQSEIIRCRNCRYNDGTAYCEVHFMDVNGNDFCSWGRNDDFGRSDSAL